MDEDWEGSEARGLGPWYYWGLSEGLAGDREPWRLSASGRKQRTCFPPGRGWGICLFLPRRAPGRGKRINLNIQLYKQCHKNHIRAQREAPC